MTQDRPIQRDWLYIPSGGAQLFGWVHIDEKSQASRIAVICNPLGVEYMSGHRSVRHLADYLARQGIPTLRFDYESAGDSVGKDITSARLADFVQNVQDAVEAAVARLRCTEIVLIGIGLGATFAALALEKISVSQLILWNPTVKGSRFVREQKLLSSVTENNGTASSNIIDAAGILLSQKLQDDLCNVDVTKVNFKTAHAVLLINRDDLKPPSRLNALVEGTSTHSEAVALPGYNKMMDVPTETVVPYPVFAYISEWVLRSAPVQISEPNSKCSEAVDFAAVGRISARDNSHLQLKETPGHFGKQKHLFGILTQAIEVAPSDRAYLFLNCGAEHHSGPHRIYTRLARWCGRNGYLAFRFDIEGIGDSFSIGNNTDNNAYSPVAVDDIAAALEHLRTNYGINEFVLSGICAGAYHTFKATVELTDFNVIQSNVINPLVFEWDYENPEDHLKFEAHTYRSSARDFSSWWRLFTGDIDYTRLFRSIRTVMLEKNWSWLGQPACRCFQKAR